MGVPSVPRKYTTPLPRLRRIGMQGRNMVEEVVCLSAQRDCTSMYNMPLLEVVGMTPTARVLHFVGVETTNHAKSKHSVLKLWLLKCHGDLGTVFLNIDSLVEGQIADIKRSLEISRVKEKFNAKSNSILRNISNKINHLALKKIWVKIKRAPEIIEDPKNKCGHYMRILHGLPYSCELITRFAQMLPLQLKDIDIDFEMHALTNLLHQISTGPISKVREMHRLAKEVLNSILPEDSGMTLTSPLEVPALDPVRVRLRVLVQVPVGEGDRHEFLRVGVENVIGDGNCGYWVVADFMFGMNINGRRYLSYRALNRSTTLYSNWNTRFAREYSPGDPIYVY
ncbi:hypothetical protein M9H77_03116 [Catharanthus roseus]|uniref:Uncharacterized protein n=1 Tax=Catharanthus roseus TaxID=4058 RepID=A0ACC0CAR2_CATRO|nr:hypothetical protein M9H77_03116 [Catharanthus roseus]